MMLKLLAVSALADTPEKITPLLGRAGQVADECRSLTLGPGNVVGYAGMPADESTVQARVFFRGGSIDLRLMREDAERLRLLIDGLVRGRRTRPLRFEASARRDGGCEFVQVTA